MADEAISQMPIAGSLSGTEVVPIVQTLLNKAVTISQLLGAIGIGLVNGALVYIDSGVAATDADIFRSGAGALTVDLLTIVSGLTLPGSSTGVDSSGNVTGTTLHAQNGFSGSGNYTNFTFVDGVCVAASV